MTVDAFGAYHYVHDDRKVALHRCAAKVYGSSAIDRELAEPRAGECCIWTHHGPLASRFRNDIGPREFLGVGAVVQLPCRLTVYYAPKCRRNEFDERIVVAIWALITSRSASVDHFQCWGGAQPCGAHDWEVIASSPEGLAPDMVEAAILEHSKRALGVQFLMDLSDMAEAP